MKQGELTPPVRRSAAFALEHRRFFLLVAWLIASAILWIALRQVDWATLARVVVHAHVAWVVAAVALNALVLPLWSAAWYALWRDASQGDAARPPRRVLFEINALTSALGNTVPFMLGATTTVALLAKRGHLGTKGAVTLMAFDQVLEGITKMVLFGVVALTVRLPDWMSRGMLLVCLAVVALVVGATLTYRGMRRRQLVLPVPLSVARGATSLVCYLGIKALEMLAIVAVQRSLGLSLGVAGALFILTVVLLGTIVPVAPANLGPYELAAFAGYRYLGVQPDVCVALALLQHACFLIPAVGPGYVFLAARAIGPRSWTDERSR